MTSSGPSFWRSSFWRSSLWRSVLIAFLLGCFSAVGGPLALAQTDSDRADRDPPGQFRISFLVGIPQGEFGWNASRGFGAQLDYGGWLGEARPVMLGLDGSIFTYGRATDRVPFSRTVGPRVPIEVQTTNSVGSLHLFLRLQERRGAFRPYVEMLGGFKYLYSRTEVETPNRRYSGRNNIASALNYDSFAWSGGFGGGVDIQVVGPSPDDGSVRTVNIHIGAQYLLGSEAEYLEEGSLQDQNQNGRLDRDELRVERSSTTSLQLKVGVSFRVGRF